MIKTFLDKFESFLEKQKTKFMSILPYLLLFFIIFLLLYFQHRLITMYFDDFGNASLSYGQTSEDIIGTNYTFAQLKDWCIMIYNTWGGRILWASVFLIPMLKTGAGFYFAVQSAVLTFIFYFLFKIAEQITKTRHIFIPILLLILYGLIHMVYLKHGIYWASASILYIWPLLPLFAFIYLYLRITEKIEKKEKVRYSLYLPILLLLNFFATFSQEQIGVAMVVFLLLYIVLNHRKKIKQYLLLDIPNLVVTLTSFAFLIGAPGNWVRMNTNEEFANLSFFGKMINNFPTSIESIFHSEMTIFVFVLTMLLIACIIKYKDKLRIKNRNIMIPMGSFLLFTLLCYFLQKYSKNIVVIYGVIWIIYFGIWTIIYACKTKKLSIISIAISGCGSIFCLLVSPVLGGRTNLPFIFFIFILIAILASDLLKGGKVYIEFCFLILMIPFALKAAVNYYIVYNGYLRNYAIEILNYKILKHSEGTEAKEITLYICEEPWFGSTRSYEEPSMDYWIKEYFNIPQDVQFKWVDIYEDVRK